MGSEDFQIDPWPTYAWFREHDPIHWSSKDRCFYVFRYDHVDHVLRSPDFSVEHPCRASRQVLGETILDIDGASHARIRSVLAPHFPPRSVETYAGEIIEPVLESVLTDLTTRETADLVSDLAVRVPVRVVLRVFGIPDEDPAWIYAQVRPIIDFLDYSRGGAVTAMTASRALSTSVRSFIDRMAARADGRGPVVDLIKAHVEASRLSYDELVSNLLLLLVAGTETTVGAIANTFAVILSREGTVDEMRSRPAFVGDVVRECLRWEPPLLGTARFATADVNVDGTTIPAGAAVVLLIGSANRDERRFEDADTWNPSRREAGHMSFGSGPHHCLGFNLGQKELDLTFRRFFERFAAVRPIDGRVPAIRGRYFRAPSSLPVHLTPGRTT